MLSTHKLVQISNKLNRPVNGQLGSLAFLSHYRPTSRFDDKPTKKSAIDLSGSLDNSSTKSSVDSPTKSGATSKNSPIFSSRICPNPKPITKTTVNLNQPLNFSQTANLSAGHTQPFSVRHFSSSSKPENAEKSKDPFFEIDGLSKRKSRARSVFAWGLSATGAVGNTKYFNLGDLKYEQILKPFKIRYFTNMKVSR